MDTATRTKVISKNAIYSLLIKGGQILTSLILVRLLLQFLGEYELGLWLTISSVLAWMNMFNLGLGHSMRNKVAEALANNEIEKAQKYISTTYGLLTGVSTLLILLFLPLYFFVDWYAFFNVNAEISSSVSSIVLIVFGSIIIQFVIGLIRTVLSALHKIALAEVIILISNILITLGIALNLNSDNKNLLWVAILYSATPVLILIISTIFLFVKRKELCPSIKTIDRNLVPDLFTIGLKFFGLQIAVLILFTTDNFIIAKLYSPEEVTPYNIAFKYFNVVAIFFATIAAPFWSGNTDAYTKGDLSWIKNSIKKLTSLLLLIVPVIFVMIIISNDVYRIWLGTNIEIPMLLSATFGVYVFVGAWNSIFSSVINGVGILKMAFYIAMFAALINIPLSIFFATTLGFGVKGIAWATITCQLISAIIIPFQAFKILNNSATGIWKT